MISHVVLQKLVCSCFQCVFALRFECFGAFLLQTRHVNPPLLPHDTVCSNPLCLPAQPGSVLRTIFCKGITCANAISCNFFNLNFMGSVTSPGTLLSLTATSFCLVPQFRCGCTCFQPIQLPRALFCHSHPKWLEVGWQERRAPRHASRRSRVTRTQAAISLNNDVVTPHDRMSRAKS
jgi:hypothetical protein